MHKASFWQYLVRCASTLRGLIRSECECRFVVANNRWNLSRGFLISRSNDHIRQIRQNNGMVITVSRPSNTFTFCSTKMRRNAISIASSRRNNKCDRMLEHEKRGRFKIMFGTRTEACPFPLFNETFSGKIKACNRTRFVLLSRTIVGTSFHSGGQSIFFFYHADQRMILQSKSSMLCDKGNMKFEFSTRISLLHFDIYLSWKGISLSF